MRSAIDRLLRNQSANSAIEFAFVAPILLLLLFGIIAYGYIFGIYHGVQQIASEAARASVSGINDLEREAIARDFVATSVSSYALLDPARLRVTTSQSGPPRQTFEVAIIYDMTDTVFHNLGSLVALPPPVIERRAVVQRGGY